MPLTIYSTDKPIAKGNGVARKPTYRKTAAYGRFGRDDIEFPWKKMDKSAALKKAAGL